MGTFSYEQPHKVTTCVACLCLLPAECLQVRHLIIFIVLNLLVHSPFVSVHDLKFLSEHGVTVLFECYNMKQFCGTKLCSFAQLTLCNAEYESNLAIHIPSKNT